jgi:hypothetical protein
MQCQATDNTYVARWTFRGDDERAMPIQAKDQGGKPLLAAEVVSKRAAGLLDVLPREDRPRRLVATLAAAVAAAQAGDTIEVHGNGPIVSDLVRIKKPLRIRAAGPSRPVILFRHQRAEPFWGAMLEVTAPVVLEGLELHYARPAQGSFVQAITVKSDLRMTHCRVVAQGETNPFALSFGNLELHRCEVLSDAWPGFRWNFDGASRLTVDESVLAGPGTLTLHLHSPRNKIPDLDVRLSRSTVVGGGACLMWLLDQTAPLPQGGRTPIRVASSNNLFGSSLVRLDCNVAGEYQQPARAKALLRQTIQWTEGRSLYPQLPLLGLMDVKKGQFHALCSGTAEWDRFWGQPVSGAVAGQARFAGGDIETRLRGNVHALVREGLVWPPPRDLDTRLRGNIHALAPADFRLVKGSPGQGAGPGGKDLGADVDLIGPGAAYHRWRQTPAYRAWEEQTRKLMGGAR